MEEVSNHKEQKKSIKITVTEEEYQRISDEAKAMKYPISKYTKLKILDTTAGMEQRSRQVMQLMPKFYSYVADIADSYIRQELTEIGGEMCRYLK